MKQIKKENPCTRVLMAYVQLALVPSCGEKRPSDKSHRIATRGFVLMCGVILTLLLLSTTVHALGIAPAQVKIPQEVNFAKQVSGLIVNNEHINRTVQVEVDDPHNIIIDIQKEIAFNSDEEQKPFKYKIQLPTTNVPTGTVAHIRIHDIQTSTSQVQASITLEVPIIIQGPETQTTPLPTVIAQPAQPLENTQPPPSSESSEHAKQSITPKQQSTTGLSTSSPPITIENDTSSAEQKTAHGSGSITLAILILLVWIVGFISYIRYKKDQ